MNPLAPYVQIREALEMIRKLPCPNCDGSGSKMVPLGEHYVSREMAMDAGDPSMEGMSCGIEYAEEQCQWCDERSQALQALEAQEAGMTDEEIERIVAETETDLRVANGNGISVNAAFLAELCLRKVRDQGRLPKGRASEGEDSGAPASQSLAVPLSVPSPPPSASGLSTAIGGANADWCETCNSPHDECVCGPSIRSDLERDEIIGGIVEAMQEADVSVEDDDAWDMAAAAFRHMDSEYELMPKKKSVAPAATLSHDLDAFERAGDWMNHFSREIETEARAFYDDCLRNHTPESAAEKAWTYAMGASRFMQDPASVAPSSGPWIPERPTKAMLDLNRGLIRLNDPHTIECARQIGEYIEHLEAKANV